MNKQAYIKLGRGRYGNRFDYSLLPTTVPKRGPVDIICKTHGKFKYRVNNKFYKNFIELCNALKLSSDTSVKDVEQYRSYNVLTACLDSNI